MAAVSDGARGCGIAIVEAPELLFVEAMLPGLTGAEVVRRVRQCSPGTLVAAQVPHAEDTAVLLAAGAAAVWPQQVPPADVLDDLAELLRLHPDAPPGSQAAADDDVVVLTSQERSTRGDVCAAQ